MGAGRAKLTDDTGAVAAADLVGRVVGLAATAVDVLRAGRLAVQRAVAAPTLPVIVHDRLAAARVRAEHSISDLSSAADVGRAVVGRRSIAAVVGLAVDDGVAAASGISSVDLLHDSVLTASVSLVIVHLQTHNLLIQTGLTA